MAFSSDQIQSYSLPTFTEPADKETPESLLPQQEGEESQEDNTDISESEPISKFSPAVYESKDFSDEKVEVATTSLSSQSEEDKKISISENFNSATFTPEQSLLTDAEGYSNTIREGARIYSERLHSEADSQHAEAEKILSEAESIKKEAEQEKQRLIEEANTQVDSVKEAAYQEGLAKGREAGAKQRYEELAPQAQQADEFLAQLSRLRQIVRFQGEQELLQLSVLIAKKVVHEELIINPDVLYNIVRESIREIEALGKIRVVVNPGDYDFMSNCKVQLEKYIKEEQTLVIQQSIDAEPGSILIETDETIVNFHFESQFSKIEEALSDRLNERQSHQFNVDIDAHDFDSPPEEHSNDDRSET